MKRPWLNLLKPAALAGLVVMFAGAGCHREGAKKSPANLPSAERGHAFDLLAAQKTT